jgi:hypothetical protein
MRSSSASTNKNGVKGLVYKTSIKEQEFIPECCTKCDHLEIESEGNYNQYFLMAYCGINLKMPTKKGTCKRKIECK